LFPRQHPSQHVRSIQVCTPSTLVISLAIHPSNDHRWRLAMKLPMRLSLAARLPRCSCDHSACTRPSLTATQFGKIAGPMPRWAALSAGNHLRAGNNIGSAGFGNTFSRHVARQLQLRRSRAAEAARPYARQAQAAPPPIYREQLSDPAHIGAQNNSSVPVQACCLCPVMAGSRWQLSARLFKGGLRCLRPWAEPLPAA